jgi:group I intron endonuclease
MIVTGFLGLSNSPKWFKYNNNIQIKNINNSPFINVGSKRQFSTNSIKLDLSNTLVINNEKNNNYSEEVSKFLKDKNLKPIFVYENLEESSIKSKIYKEVKNLAGIYLILNKFNGDYYIGSASTNRFYSRFCKHLINKSGSKIVKTAVNKYKIFSFAFVILEIFPEVVNKENNKKLLDLEDFYLKSLLPNYNILTEAGNSFGYKHTEISRIKMKSGYSEECRARIGNLNKGKFFTNEKREIYSLAAFNRKKAVYSKEALLNMKKQSKSITVYNFDGTIYGEYSSITEGANNLACGVKTINRALKTPKQILKRR